MSTLSPLFLWLIPLALLPVIIHLLNRLRYQTVRWAAMMFLRSADRDASRRAKIRQWLILAARCLMLLMFLLALSRLQSKGRLARFFDPGSNLVVILFDRSASMEQLRGGVTGRERALSLLNQGLAELSPGARVIWMDSATGELTPLPNAIDLERLPMVGATATASDVSAMLRSALQEIARAGVTKAEVWIPTDRQSSAWLPDGANLPDWREWAGISTQITLRLLDVAQVAPDAGNRTLQLLGKPVWDGQELLLQFRLLRDNPLPETVPLQIDFGGLSLREEIMVEGPSFTWEQRLPVEEDQERIHALFALPADSNMADNRVALSWQNSGARKAVVETGNAKVDGVMRAALLPREGLREIVSEATTPAAQIDLKVLSDAQVLEPEDLSWIENGGILLRLPAAEGLEPVGEEDNGLGVESWQEQSGVLATEQMEPLRLDLVRVFQNAGLSPSDENMRVLARLEDGQALLTRQSMGDGAVYRLSTLPLRGFSNLDAGYVLVPMLQRMLLEAGQGARLQGVHTLGDVNVGKVSGWESMDGPELSPLLHVGRFRSENGIVALNRQEAEDRRESLSVQELETWAKPLPLRIFEDRSAVDTEINSRFEFTTLLCLLGFIFLVIESWLLTRNVRRTVKAGSAWRAAA